MSKRIKINFESVNKGKFTIIPKKDIYDVSQRIRKHMKKFIKKQNFIAFNPPQ